jgi:beta-mannanase
MYADQASAVRSTGIEPIVTWDPMTASGPINLPDIVAGQYDGYLRTSAQVVKAFARPVLIRFDHEMNLPNAGADPAIFVAAWRHVVNVFREVGAANAQFVWSPNVDCTGQCPFTSYFPGDPWVDWVGLDGYNAGSNNWQSLEAVFASSYRTLSRLTSRPMMIAETASAESGGSKATWIRTGLLDTVAGEFPRIRMVVWFDRLKERDWRVNSSPSALAAFRDVLQSPTVRASPATASGCGSGAAP